MGRFTNHLLFLYFIFWLTGLKVYSASNLTPLEQALQYDIEDSYLNDFSHTEAAFILSGVGHADSLKACVSWYNSLVSTIKDFPLDPFNRIESAKKVFLYLHATWLKKYQVEATTLVDVMKAKRFNCVSGTILFNLLCSDMGWPTKAFETPSHTYTIFSDFTRDVMVENTNAMGFDIMKNLKAYSKYLAHFYPENQVLKIGLDRLYAYENSKGRMINNTELLGLLAYNRAYFALKDLDHAQAYEYVLLAQLFNSDSRSNIQFEINLYYRWGKELIQRERFTEAFEVYADGVYRYPEIKDFAKNTRIALFNCLQNLWKEKEWFRSKQLIDETVELDILGEKDYSKLEAWLRMWIHKSIQDKNKEQARSVFGTFQYLFPEHIELENFKAFVDDLP